MVNKRLRYILHSFLIGLIIYFYSTNINYLIIYTALLVFVVVVGNVIVNRENSPSIPDNFYISLLPLHLIFGSILTLYYFPNLSFLFKVIFVIGIAFLNYIILLVNNIFLVVISREESIPLYRVALTWSKIVIIVLSIPLFAGIFKLPANTFIQSALTGVSAFLFCMYVIWSMKFESEAKKHGAGEAGYLSAVGAMCVTFANMIVTFMPTESFLRALFVSSVLMFIINYFYAHFKNAINRRLVTEHIAISLVFLLLLVLFKP